MTEAENPPRWAIERALALLGALATYGTADEALRYAAEPACNRYARQVLAFARYIAEHEEPPVDPLLAVYRAALSVSTNSVTVAVQDRHLAAFRDELAKRGIELARSDNGGDNG